MSILALSARYSNNQLSIYLILMPMIWDFIQIKNYYAKINFYFSRSIVRRTRPNDVYYLSLSNVQGSHFVLSRTYSFSFFLLFWFWFINMIINDNKRFDFITDQIIFFVKYDEDFYDVLLKNIEIIRFASLI